jgi:6-phosphogluconolactonase
MRRWAGQALAVMGIWALGMTTGCGNFFVYPGTATSSGTGSTAGDYVYVANANTSTPSLAGFAVGTGTLTAVSGSPYSLDFIPTAVAVNPADSIVFVAGSNGIDGFINSYSIGSSGELTLLVSNNTGSASEVSIDVSPDGQWLMGLDANGSSIGEAIVDEYQINSSTGQLTQGTGTSYTYTGTPTPTIVPRQIKFAPNGAYVFAAVGTAGDLVFPFTTSTGVFSTPLSLSLGTSSTASDNALAVNPTSTTLYIARSGTNGGMAVYTIGSGGSLSEISGSPLTAGNQPFSVAVNFAGTDVYVANQLDSTISEYSIGSTGAVAALSPATVTTESAARALAVDRSGDYLLAIANGGSPDLSMYSYSTTTAGELVFSTSIATGTDPTYPVAVAVTH